MGPLPPFVLSVLNEVCYSTDRNTTIDLIAFIVFFFYFWLDTQHEIQIQSGLLYLDTKWVAGNHTVYIPRDAESVK